MSTENVRNIHEILESIEALKDHADHLYGMYEHQDNAPEQDSLSASLVAEMAERKADVVLLDDVYRKGKSQQDIRTDSSTTVAHQKSETRSAPGLGSMPSEAEFDQLLSTLMKDMEHETKKTGTPREPKLSTKGKSGKGNFNELSNLEADIDGLLSPYLNIAAASSNQQPTSAPKSAYIQKVEKQGKPQQPPKHKGLSDEKLLSAMITDEMRTEIANYILAEIKQQISGWIAENLEIIVEEALRSLSTEARDSVKARSVR